MHDKIDWSDVHQYRGGTPEQNRARFKSVQIAALSGMRTVAGWTATCPSQHVLWGSEEMRLNRAGGCASSEGLPAGGGIAPNWERLTAAKLAIKYGARYQGTSNNLNPSPESVPSNVRLAVRYEATERNVRGIAQIIKQARVSNSPNLYWLMDCPDIVTTYGADLQDAVGHGGDVVMCIDGWGALRDSVTGRLPPWWHSPYYRPTWAQ